ncbi:MAG: InlB B-repeat-containing protein [Spirochaetia bacterium]|nr:InlB B-repeat-containing protein [Spirochaetia bacterium]
MTKAVKFLGKALAVLFFAVFVFGCKQVTEEKTYYLNTYTVQFDANGGSGTMKSQTFSQNKEQQISKNAFEAPDGSQFAGWSTEPDASSDEIEYTDNQSIAVKENMTLYAIWKMVEGRGTNTETKDFQFVFDDWQTTDESVKPGDDFYEYSVGKFLDLDKSAQLKKSIIFSVVREANSFLKEQAQNPTFNLGKIYKELAEEEISNNAVFEYLQSEVDKIDSVTTIPEYYELFVEYMWADMPYLGFDISFSGRKSQLQIKNYILFVDCKLNESFEEYYNPDDAKTFFDALQDSSLTASVADYRKDENSLSSIIMQSIVNKTGISEAELSSSFSVHEYAANALKHLDLISQSDEGAVSGLTLENAKQFLRFIAAKKCYDNYNNKTLKINQYQFYYPLLKEYQKKYDPDGKRKAYLENLCNEMIATFKKRIDKNPWMSDTTKDNAKKKADKMLVLIGYPDNFPDEFMFENISRSEKGWNCTAQMINDITEQIAVQHVKSIFSSEISPSDKIHNLTVYYDNVFTYNAHYSSDMNCIYVNIPDLSETLLKLDASDAYNYSFIGSTLAHEFCHAFDSYGAQYGPNGERTEWWTISDKLRYKEKQNQMISLYNQFVISSDGSAVSGERTLDENLADLGGLTVAYDTFLSKKIGELTDNALMEQRKVFFQTWAIVWAIPDTGDWQYDVHSPFEFRTRGIVCNMDDWYSLYDVKFGDAYYLSPDQRIVLW